MKDCNPDVHFLNIEREYYKELDEQHSYSVALEQRHSSTKHGGNLDAI